jgi:hypothetical protein
MRSKINKKIILTTLTIILLAMSLLLSGCIDYKAAGDDSLGDEDLVDSDLVDIDADVSDESDGEEGTDLEEDENNEDFAEEESVDESDSSDTEGLQRIEVDESEEIDLSVMVIDPDEDEVSYFFSSPLSEEGFWQTNYGDAGEYVVTLTATDGVNTVSEEILIVVNRVNVAPEIDTLVDLSYNEGDEIVFGVEVDDPNGDEVEVEISEPLSSGLFETDHTSSGEYEIVVVASDGELSSEDSFILTIVDVSVLPVISGVNDLDVAEGDTVELDIEVEDLDGDEVTITISEPVGDDGIWEIGFTENGKYEVTITADDGKDVVTETITILVEDVNMPPEIIEVSLERN